MKKIVKLASPAVDDTGAVRHPQEGALTVSADLARRWEEAGNLEGKPEDPPADDDQPEAQPKTAQRGARKEA